jgi:hypothetical protein
MAQWIVRATPIGNEEFYFLLEGGLFNAALIEHIHTCQPTVCPVEEQRSAWRGQCDNLRKAPVHRRAGLLSPAFASSIILRATPSVTFGAPSATWGALHAFQSWCQ